jgi:hypothetical protein
MGLPPGAWQAETRQDPATPLHEPGRLRLCLAMAMERLYDQIIEIWPTTDLLRLTAHPYGQLSQTSNFFEPKQERSSPWRLAQ